MKDPRRQCPIRARQEFGSARIVGSGCISRKRARARGALPFSVQLAMLRRAQRRLFSRREVTATQDHESRGVCPIRGSVSPFVHGRRTFGHFGVALGGFLAVTSPPENEDSKAWTYQPRNQPNRSSNRVRVAARSKRWKGRATRPAIPVVWLAHWPLLPTVGIGPGVGLDSGAFHRGSASDRFETSIGPRESPEAV